MAFALTLAEGAVALFYDEKNGCFFQGEERADLVLRLKGQFDSAIPTESSVGAREFSILSEITGREDLQKVAEKTLGAYLAMMKEAPSSMGEMLMSLEFLLEKPARLVIAGDKGRETMLQVVAGDFDPTRIVLGTKGLVSDFTAGLEANEGKATAYYCVGQTCQLPVNDPTKLRELLVRMRGESK